MRLITAAIIANALAALAASPGHAGAASAEMPKHLIVMIADGAGHNTLAATRFWTAQPLAVDSGPWLRAAMATHGLRKARAVPAGGDPHAQDPEIVYDPAKAWDTTPAAGSITRKSRDYPVLFKGYDWLRRTAPDSANTMTAMMTGVRTYDGAINVDGADQPLPSVAEAAKAAGRMAGIVSSVPFNHATPAAGGGAHGPSRGDYHALARQMFAGPLDVIGGAGNPDYDDDGRPVADTGADTDQKRFQWMPRDLWAALKRPDARWTLVESADAVRALAAGDTRSDRPLAMIAPAAGTLQADRSYPPGVAPGTAHPGAVPVTPGMMTLSDMARAALAHMSVDPDGFFLMIEGGAVDWAMHDNELPRMIEEYMAFDDAVRAVVRWIESPHSAASWDDTLLIVTADHDHLLLGPDPKIPFQRVTNAGAGRLPGHAWGWDSHSNKLVPIFARGKGADTLIARATAMDEHTDKQGRKFGNGRYLTQADLGAFLLKTQGK